MRKTNPIFMHVYSSLFETFSLRKLNHLLSSSGCMDDWLLLWVLKRTWHFHGSRIKSTVPLRAEGKSLLIIRSVFSKHFILARITVDPEPFLGSQGVMQKYTLYAGASQEIMSPNTLILLFTPAGLRMKEETRELRETQTGTWLNYEPWRCKWQWYQS